MDRYLRVCSFSLFVFLSLAVFSQPAHARLAANPTSINFGNQPVGLGGVSIPVTLSNTDLSRTFTIVNIASSDSNFSVAGASPPTILPPGQSLTVNVVFTPSSAQNFSGTVGFTTYYGWTVNVPLSGVGIQSQSGNQLSVNPSAVNFGNVALGSRATQLVQLSNPTGSSIALNNITTLGSDVSIAFSPGTEVAPGQTLVLAANFSPSAAENASGQLLFLTDASDSPITVGWSGQSGQSSPASTNQASISVSPASLNFGTVNIGSGNTQSFAITNSGSTPVTLVNISAAGSEIVIGGSSTGAVIEPGQSVTGAATYFPRFVENSSGYISVFTDSSTLAIQIPWSGSTPQAASAAAAQAQSYSGTTAQPQTSSIAATQTQTPSTPAAVNDSVSILWNPSGSNGVVGYNVYRGMVSGGPYNLITPAMVSANAYIDTAVSSGQTYYYVVTSLASGAIESSYSPEVVATIP
jgi:hypothetical protein